MEWSGLIEDIERVLGISPQMRGELARRIEVRPGIVSDIRAGKSKNPSADFALRLINRLGVNPRWLEAQELPILLEGGDIYPPKETPRDFPGTNIPRGLEAIPGAVYLNSNGREIVANEYVAVSLLEQKVSAGTGKEVLDFDSAAGVIPVLKRMLRGMDPSGAFGAEVKGDSMTGERIFDGDMVVFYRGLIREHGLYVLFRDGRLFVKRLTFNFSTQRIKISSANEMYPEVEEVADSQALMIAGKVLGWVHVHPY